METIEALKKANRAIGDLIGCFADDPDKKMKLEGARDMILDVALDNKVSANNHKNTNELYELVANNAKVRMKNALMQNNNASMLAGLLESEALLDAAQETRESRNQ